MTNYESTDYFSDASIPPDPYPYFEFLLDRPVWREPHHGVVMVSGYEEARAVYNDPATFSSCNFVAGPEPGFPVPLEGDDISDIIEKYRDQLPSSDLLSAFDPPKHTDLRSLIMRLITPKRLHENESFMWRLADRQLDLLLSQPRCEFMREYAEPYTLLVVSELLGVPESDFDELLSKMGHNRLPGVVDQRPTVGQSGTITPGPYNSLSFVHDYFAEAIARRRHEPQDDVLTGMAHATYPDGSLPDPIEGGRIAAMLFAAAQETTLRLLGTALRRIAEDGDLQQLLRSKRELIPNFVEETLRTEGPTKGSFRLARVSTTLGGVDIPAGTTIMVLRGAASRDPRHFECPAEFRVDRPNARQHIMFGHGIHTCPGAPLARSEVRVSIERLFDRTADIEISEEFHGAPDARRYDYLPSYMFRGLTQLYLDFTPIDSTEASSTSG